MAESRALYRGLLVSWVCGPLRRYGFVAALLAAAPACSNVNVFSLEQDVEIGKETYAEILKENRKIDSGPDAEMVQRVTQRLVEAAVARDPEFESFDWHADLLDSPTINAFCLPGGQMAVYTGILPYTQTEEGLAVVMGHEIAHATRRHGTQKITRSLGLELLSLIASGYADPEIVRAAANVAVDLPYGRKDEFQADHFGLLYMARAGYDPREAPAFWQRMNQLPKSDVPDFLSTHPSNEDRIAQIESFMTEAVAQFEAAKARLPSP